MKVIIQTGQTGLRRHAHPILPGFWWIEAPCGQTGYYSETAFRPAPSEAAGSEGAGSGDDPDDGSR